MKNAMLAAMIVAALSVTDATRADLLGTNFSFHLKTELLSPLPPNPVLITFNNTGIHTYGTVQTGVDSTPIASLVLTLDSTLALLAGFTNRVNLDLSLFGYQSATAPVIGTFTVTGLADLLPVDIAANLKVFSNGVDVGFGIVAMTANSFVVKWDAASVNAAHGGIPGPRSVDVVWNSVPTPGVLALLGMAGFTTRRRRRQGLFFPGSSS